MPADKVLDMGTAGFVDSDQAKQLVRYGVDVLWKAIKARDRGCVWSGCDRPANWCDVHHVNWFVRDLGRRTSTPACCSAVFITTKSTKRNGPSDSPPTATRN